MTLQINPTHWWSWDFKVSDQSQPVAEIAINSWRDKGKLIIGGAAFRVYREAPLSGDFVLEGAGGVLARAEKPSVFRRAFVIHHAGREYTLRSRSMFRRDFILLDGGREVGSIAPNGIFTRHAVVDFPASMPVPLRMFIVWLAMISWRWDARSSAA